MTVKFKDIKDAFDFVSFGDMYSSEAYLCKGTGKIYCHTEFDDVFEPLPDDLDDEKYISIPHKNDLNLGKRLVMRFVYQYLESDIDKVEGIFSKKGAYSRFKGLLEQRGVIDTWYRYEEEAQGEALREWCEINEIDIDDE